MRWPWLPPSRGDILAIALCVALGLIFAFIIGPRFMRSNPGFGPDWDCTNGPQGAVCVKRVPPIPAENTKSSN